MSGRLRSLLGIAADWPERWESLNRGKRKRFHIGDALSREPGMLVLDEPVNHVDLHAGRLTASSSPNPRVPARNERSYWDFGY